MLVVPRMLLDMELVLGSMGLEAVLEAMSWLVVVLGSRVLVLARLLDSMEVVVPIIEALLDIMGVLFVMMELLGGIMDAAGRCVVTRW